MKIKHTLIALTLICSAALAAEAELGQFKSYQAPVEQAETRIAFIDMSDFSLNWLVKYQQYLIDQKIPVMIIDGTELDAKKLGQRYSGLLIGPAPQPVTFLNLFLQQLSISKYPAVVESGVIWQSKNVTQ